VLSMDLIAYPHLQSEAIYRLLVNDFPVIVAYDSVGNILFSE
jgi:tartrate dehydratase beta subunit/fumarate hydratase class I family protein